MFVRLLSWPKVFAILVAGVALSGLIDRLRFVHSWHSAQFREFGWSLAFVGLLSLAYPLFRAREWARRVLFVVVILFGVWLVLPRGIVIFAPRTYSGIPQSWMIRETILGDISDFLLGLAVLTFFILVLCHPDVIARFRKD